MHIKLKRFFAALIDHIVCTALSIVIPFKLVKYKIVHTDYIGWIFLAIFSTYILLLLLKDIAFKNSSIGKRIFKIKIVRTDNKRFNIINCFFRNITLVLFPLEIYRLFAKDKRLGDLLAKTLVVENTACQSGDGSLS